VTTHTKIKLAKGNKIKRSRTKLWIRPEITETTCTSKRDTFDNDQFVRNYLADDKGRSDEVDRGCFDGLVHKSNVVVHRQRYSSTLSGRSTERKETHNLSQFHGCLQKDWWCTPSCRRTYTKPDATNGGIQRGYPSEAFRAYSIPCCVYSWP
jgi:hypothetical protein